MEQMKNTVKFDRRSFSHKLREKADETREKVAAWVTRNKEEILFYGPMVIGAVTTGVKVVGRVITKAQQKNTQDLRCWDPREGHFWKLRHKLTTSEWKEVSRRRQNGERLEDILDDFRVLK